MAFTTGLLRNLTFVTLLGGAVSLGGCGGGVGLDVDAPILDAVGINLVSKKKDDEDLPERPGLVVPPSTEKLPEPGTHTASVAQQNWPQDPDQIKKRKEADAIAAEEKYCAEGDWSAKANITEFEKNTGREARCPSKLGKAINKNIAKSDTPNR